MLVVDFLKVLCKVFVCVEEIAWDSIFVSMFPDTRSSASNGFKSAINVHVNERPGVAEDGIRAVTANVITDDPLEGILAYSIEAETLSLRLQRSGQDNVPIRRAGVIHFVNMINNRIMELVEWFDGCMADQNYTEDYKRAVRNIYKNCTNAINNFNEYVNRVNAGESDIVWALPDSGVNIPSLTPLPNR